MDHSAVLLETRQREEARQSLEDQLITFAGHMNAAEYRLICLLDEFDQADGWQGDGIRSFSHWLNWRMGMGSVIAREKIRIARALRELPRTAEAFRLGEISYSKVRAITRAGSPENEEFLLMIARHGTASHLDKLVSKFKRVKVRMVDYDEEPRWKPDSSFSCYFDDDGSLVFRGRLPPDEGELLVKAIESMQLRMLEDQQQDKQDEVVGETNVPAEAFSSIAEYNEENVYQRNRAEALVKIAEHYCASSQPEVSSLPSYNRNQVFLHINPTLGANYLDSGHYVPDKIVKQFTCDASITPVIEGADGNVISIGRKSRVVPPKMRFAVDQRDDGCCRFPGCNQHNWTDKHHVKHWSDGGETSIDNLITLCRRHHRLLHKGEYAIRAEHNRFVFVDKLQREIPVAFFYGTGESLETLNSREGLGIDNNTAACQWLGEQMDYGDAVAVMFAADSELQ